MDENKNEKIEQEQQQKQQVEVESSAEDNRADCESEYKDAKSTNDQDSCVDASDKEIQSINEAVQEQIKNSEDSNYEDLEDSNSPFLMKQIKQEKEMKQLEQQESSETTKENQKNEQNLDDYEEEDYDEDEEYDDEDEEGDDEEGDSENDGQEDEEDDYQENEQDENCKELQKETNPEIVTPVDEKPIESRPLELKEEETKSVIKPVLERKLSRQTSVNSNNSGSTPANPALAPTNKKGQFYEHDNRDDDGEKTNDAPSAAQTSEKVATNKLKKTQRKNTNEKKYEKQSKLETSTSGSTENVNSVGKWGHDLYESIHQKSDHKRGSNRQPRMNNETNKGFLPNQEKILSSYKARPRPRHYNTRPRDEVYNKVDTQELPENNLPQQDKIEDVKPKEKVTKQPNKSKGLSLSEYLEQNETGADSTTLATKQSNESEHKPKQNRRPNMQTYQVNPRYSSNYNQNENGRVNTHNFKKQSSNEQQQDYQNLKSRLDFSTRKPINSSNFDNPSGFNEREHDYEFRTNNRRDDQRGPKLNLKITTNFDSPTTKRFVQEEGNPIKNNNNHYHSNRPNSNSFNTNTQNNPRKNFNKSNNQDTYDDYYYQEEETNDARIGHFRARKPFERTNQNDSNKFNPNNANNINNNEFNINNHHGNRMKPKPNFNDQAPNNYNDYIDISLYNNTNTNNDYNQPFTTFHVKTQSYSNSNFNRNQINRNFNDQQQQQQQQNFQPPPQQYYQIGSNQPMGPQRNFAASQVPPQIGQFQPNQYGNSQFQKSF